MVQMDVGCIQAKMNVIVITLLSVAVVFAPVKCKDDMSKMVVTTNATLGQAPYQVSLRNSSGLHYCSGSIINDRWILTTAYCLRKATPAFIAVGSINLDGNYTRYKVLHSLVHIFYNPVEAQNDLGLIKTREQINFTISAQPIQLGTEDIPDGVEMMASGWDLTMPKNSTHNTLQLIYTNKFNQTNCTTLLNAQKQGPKVNDGHLCVLKSGGNAFCYGESGGPVVYNNKLYGVLSTSDSCIKGNPGVLSKVSANMLWINFVQTLFFFP